MAIRTEVNPIAPFWYVLKRERPANEAEALDDSAAPSRFKLRGLRAIEMFDVSAGSEVTSEKKVLWASRSVKQALTLALLGWDNVLDEEGQPVEFSANTEENFARLDYLTMSELFAAILAASNITAAQRKN